MRRPRFEALSKAAALKSIILKCKRARACPHCHLPNGTVKRISGCTTLKIVHERYKGRHMQEEVETLLSDLGDAVKSNPNLRPALAVAVEDLLPTRVLHLFKNIPDRDCEVLWIDPIVGRPENLILESILVPPVPIRPSVAMDQGGGSNEDDLTVKLQEILDVNVALKIALSKGPQTSTIMEEWDFLQVQVAQYVNGEMPSFYLAIS